MSDYLRTCEKAARAGGEVLLQWRDRFSVREKAPADLVTDADLASQEVIRKIITDAYPNHHFVGEEGPDKVDLDPEFVWLVDPLDGTTNYVHQLPSYSVSVALIQNGRPIAGAIFDPVSDECFTAERGQGASLNGTRINVSDVDQLKSALVAISFPPKVQRDAPEISQFVEVMLHAQAIRRMGSAALNLSYVAMGRLDAYWASVIKPWDIAAGVLFVEEAGGVVTSFSGGPLDLVRADFLASANEQIHEQLLQILKDHR